MEAAISKATLDAEPEDRFVRLGRELGTSAFGLNLIVLEPRQRLRIHVHENQEEVYVVLDGALSLFVETEETLYGRGDVVRVAPAVRRQILNRGPGRLRLIAIGGAGEHVRRDATAYRSWDDTEGAPAQDVPLPDDLPDDG